MSEGFLSNIVENFFFEKLDKQILNKIPYFLCLGIFISILFFINDYMISRLGIVIFTLDFKFLFTISLIFEILFLFCFISLTYQINNTVNEALEDVWVNLDWDKFGDKITDIYEGQTSLWKDAKNVLKDKFVVYGLISGLILGYLLTWIFAYVFIHFKIPIEIQFLSAVIVVIFIFQEVLKFSPLKDYSNSTEPSMGANLMELYTVENSLKETKIAKPLTKVLFHIVARLVGPLILINEPDIMIERLIVYHNPDIKSIIDKYRDKENKKLQHFFELWKYQFKFPLDTEKLSDDMVIERFFNKRDGESIRNFIDERLVDLFPYLFKGEYFNREEIKINLDPTIPFNSKIMPSITKKSKQIVGFRVQTKGKTPKTTGFFIIHSFKGLPTNPIVLTRPTKSNVMLRTDVLALKKEQVDVFHIFMYGDRSFMSFLKTKFQMNSKTYSMDMLQREPPESDKSK